MRQGRESSLLWQSRPSQTLTALPGVLVHGAHPPGYSWYACPWLELWSVGSGQYQGGEGLRDLELHLENGPVFVLGTRDLGPCLLGSGAGGRGSAAAAGYTAVDSGAFTAGRKGERLGWRNFKDCCRQEGLGTPWSGQSCRSNPIAACLEEWRGMGGARF